MSLVTSANLQTRFSLPLGLTLHGEVPRQRPRSLLARVKTGPAANAKTANNCSTVTHIETE